MSEDMDSDIDSDADQDTPPWRPDEQMIPALLAGSRTVVMADLPEIERAWAVAGMKIHRVPGSKVADLMGCSVRQVRKVAALSATRAFFYAQTETANWVNEKRLADNGRAQLERELAEALTELARTREKLNRLIDAQIVGADSCGRCGTPWDRGNTYWRDGKRFCRCCQARRNRNYRARRREKVAAAFTELLASPTPEHAAVVRQELEDQAADLGIATGSTSRPGPRTGPSPRP